jgi:hypothetical protein
LSTINALQHVTLWTGQSPNEPVAPSDQDDATVERELATYVAPFVAMLPSPYREALTLTELEGISQKDAALMLGISVSGMKSRVQRGRQHLRSALEDCCHIAIDARGRVYEPRSMGTAEWVLWRGRTQNGAHSIELPDEAKVHAARTRASAPTGD